MTRSLSLLGPAEVARLRAEPLTGTPIGLPRADPPSGWDRIGRTARIGAGRPWFAAASRALLTWQVQLRAGVGVAASSPQVHLDAVAVLRLGAGPVGVRAPVRVVRLIDQPNRQGFVYGTLPGHPRTGEESFVVELLPDGAVTFTITACSRPATRLARLVPRATLVVQRWMAGRYLRALREP